MNEVSIQYFRGLFQSKRSNMERMSETVVESDSQAFQHFISNSNWDYLGARIQVAQEASAEMNQNQARVGLLIDESGFAKKGKCSVGVARQWNGRLGKVDNCQVGVFAALSTGKQATLIDGEIYLPEKWTEDLPRCQEAGVPLEFAKYRSKAQIALEMVRRARKNGVEFDWVGLDGGYGKETWLLKTLEDEETNFVADVHRDQVVYLQDPKPAVPVKNQDQPMGRNYVRTRSEVKSITVEKWRENLKEDAWKKVNIRETTKGKLPVEFAHATVWIWTAGEIEARCWDLIVQRDAKSKEEIKYYFSSTSQEVSSIQIVKDHAQRFWIERVFEDAKSEIGMGEYQVRGWLGWNHHMTMVILATHFVTQNKEVIVSELPLISTRDIVEMLEVMLPKKVTDAWSCCRSMRERHKRRQASIDAAKNFKSSVT